MFTTLGVQVPVPPLPVLLRPVHGRLLHQTMTDTNVAAISAGPREIVFVDTRTPDYQQLLGSISPHAEVVLLDSGKDGVQQIAEALAGRSEVGAIHIISHGDAGVLLLGNRPLFSGNISQYAAQLADIGKALTADGDILLYGCDVGAGSAGQAFIAQLAAMTGADIAASDDATGGIARGGRLGSGGHDRRNRRQQRH